MKWKAAAAAKKKITADRRIIKAYGTGCLFMLFLNFHPSKKGAENKKKERRNMKDSKLVNLWQPTIINHNEAYLCALLHSQSPVKHEVWKRKRKYAYKQRIFYHRKWKTIKRVLCNAITYHMFAFRTKHKKKNK